MSEPDERPSQFYRGLVAELYEPLLSELANADDYVPFLERAGPPALELCCGSGLPLLDLVERGYEVEGLDASQDMLDRCTLAARGRGLEVTLHRAEMQSFSLARRYRAIFLAGASLTLLDSDEDAADTLDAIHRHLEPGGSALIPLEIPNLAATRKAIGHFREVSGGAGERLRVGLVGLDVAKDGRCATHRLRYERSANGSETERIERDWHRRWWSQDQFGDMLRAAGFVDTAFVSPAGGLAPPDASTFVALARVAPA